MKATWLFHINERVVIGLNSLSKVFVKKIVKSILRKLGVIIMKRESRVYLPDDETYRIVLQLCAKDAPVVIDGGAHKGSTVDEFRKLATDIKFHCFEPDASLVTGLKTKFADDLNVELVGAALGSETGTATFNINVSRPTNSLLPTAKGLQSDLELLCQTVGQVQVPLTTIDAYCEQIGLDVVDIIKLDLQGYDYLALKGASKTLRVARVVMVEVLFVEIYQGCHLFQDIQSLMLESGYSLYTLSGIHYGEHDELLWADAIFINKSIGC